MTFTAASRHSTSRRFKVLLPTVATILLSVLYFAEFSQLRKPLATVKTSPSIVLHKDAVVPPMSLEKEKGQQPLTSVVDDSDSSALQVAWIISFGGSGTSFTIHNVERNTNTTTASNYATDFDPLVPVRPDLQYTGPFVHYPISRQWPKQYILTKTHCGGYCIDCGPSTYLHSVDTFDEACRTSKLKNDTTGKEVATVYPTDVPRRVVHLIRSPFDNLMGRMHLSKKRKQNIRRDISNAANDNSKDAVQQILDSFTDTTAGVNKWCRFIQYQWHDEESNVQGEYQTARQLYGKSVSCFSEWYRYIQWHNLAYRVSREKLNLPVHYLRYEDYSAERYNETVTDLYNFLGLELSQNAKEYPFSSHAYRNIFPPDSVKLLAAMFQDLLDPPVWQLLRHYFEDPAYAPVYEIDNSSVAIHKELDSKLDNVNSDLAALSIRAAHYGPTVAWLMSFPNSGTSYTITNTERVSNTTTAANYASTFEHLVPVYANIPQGPYVHKPYDMPLPSKYILTKTHCGGFCNGCSPSKFVLDVTGFDKACRRSQVMIKHKNEYVYYPNGLVDKAIHLIRDPFDNLVARQHLEAKKQDESGDSKAHFATHHNRTGYLSWCDYLDRTSNREMLESHLIPDNVKEFMASNNLPCVSDWFRYVQWHNMAVKMTTVQKEIAVQYLHYESYSLDYNSTVTKLLDFLELPQMAPPIPFIANKTYHSYYDMQDAILAKTFVQTTATPEVWDLVKHYFDWVDEE